MLIFTKRNFQGRMLKEQGFSYKVEKMDKRNLVVIGGDAAGMSAASKIRLRPSLPFHRQPTIRVRKKYIYTLWSINKLSGFWADKLSDLKEQPNESTQL